MQAFWLEAVLTFTRFPDVFSESVASRHFPRAWRLMLCCSVHGHNFIHVFPLCSLGMATVLSSDHSLLTGMLHSSLPPPRSWRPGLIPSFVLVPVLTSRTPH